MADRSNEGDGRPSRLATDERIPAQLLELARRLELAIAARWRRKDKDRKAHPSNVRTLM